MSELPQCGAFTAPYLQLRQFFYVKVHMKTKAAAIRTLLITTNHISSQIGSFHSPWFNSFNSLKPSQADLPSFSHLH